MTIAELKVTGNSVINILREYKGEELHLFDEVQIIFCINNRKLILYEDYLCEAIRSLKCITQRALDGKLETEERYLQRGIGYEENIISNKISNDENDVEDFTSQYNLWSTSSKQATETWIYSIKGEVYFEVSPQYRWNYCDPGDDDNYISFEEFLSNYTPYYRVNLSKSIIKSWYTAADKMIEEMK